MFQHFASNFLSNDRSCKLRYSNPSCECMLVIHHDNLSPTSCGSSAGHHACRCCSSKSCASILMARRKASPPCAYLSTANQRAGVSATCAQLVGVESRCQIVVKELHTCAECPYVDFTGFYLISFFRFE